MHFQVNSFLTLLLFSLPKLRLLFAAICSCIPLFQPTFCTQNTQIPVGFAFPPVPGSLMRPGQTKKHPHVLFGAGRKQMLCVQWGWWVLAEENTSWVCIPANEIFDEIKFPFSHFPGLIGVFAPPGCSGQRSIKSFQTAAGVRKTCLEEGSAFPHGVQLINLIIKPFRFDWSTQKTKVPPLPSAQKPSLHK